jgi:hypothetical protein
MVRVIVAKEKLDCEHLLGQFVDENHYDILVEEDTDCYMPADCSALATDCDKDCNNCEKGTNEKNIAFKFRKNFFSKEEQEQAYKGLREAAVPSQNRGLAAGPKDAKCGMREWATEFQLKTLDFLQKESENSVVKINVENEIQNLRERYQDKDNSRGQVWLSLKIKEDNFNFDSWLKQIVKQPIAERKRQATEVLERYISDTTYANAVNSGIAGWFDRYPRIPYGRATSYTQNHYEKFEMSFPFLQSLDRGFRELMPWRWSNQRSAADKIDQRFLVPGTVFSTITVNKTFRTACHRDAGDFSDGLSNLLVLSNDGRFTGGYLIFPEYRIAVNVRPGDLLLVNNHEIIHGNTPIVCEEGSERISLVCYLREKMLELGSYEYENLRFEFVESRRKNKNHQLWKPLWNGVSEGMWNSQEWYDYLEKHGGRKMVKEYHPRAYEVSGSLEDLFA